MKPRNAPSRSARTSAPRPPRVARAPGRASPRRRPGALATRGGRGAEVRADRLGAFLGFMPAPTVPSASVTFLYRTCLVAAVGVMTRQDLTVGNRTSSLHLSAPSGKPVAGALVLHMGAAGLLCLPA